MLTSIDWRKLCAATLAQLGWGRRGKQRTSRLVAQRARRGRPFLEALEDRTVPSTLFWDPGQSGGTALGGAGTWDTSSPNWFNGTSDVAWTNGNTAVFDGTAGNVTVGSGISAAGLTFNIDGYALAGNTLSLASPASLSVVSGASATMAENINLSSNASMSGDGNLTLSGAVNGGNSFSITKSGGGTLTLSGSTDNASMGLIVNAGTVQLAKDSSPSVHAVGGVAGLTVNSGGTVQLAGTGDYQIYQVSVSTVNSGGVFDFNGENQANGVFYFILSNGTLMNSNTGSPAALNERIVLDRAGTISGDGNLTLAGAISGGFGSDSLTKTGNGTTTLTAANSYSGGTTVNAGILKVGNASALGSNSGPGTTVHDGGALDLNSTSIGAQNLTLNGTGVSGGGALIDSGPGPLSHDTGTVTIASATTIEPTGSSTIELFGQLTGSGALTKAGGYYLTLNNTTNNFSGGFTINAGFVTLESDHALGSTSSTTTVNSGATLNFQLGGASYTTASPVILNDGATMDARFNTQSFAGPITLSGTSTITSATGNALTLSGVISGSGGFNKTGPATLTLTGANSYSGDTTISQGKLTLVNQRTFSTSVVISAGATLEYADSVNVTQFGTLTISGGGTFLKSGGGLLIFGGGIGGNINWQLAAGALIDVEGGTLKGGDNVQDVWTNNLSDLNIAAGAAFFGVEANVRVNALTGVGTLTTGYPGAGYITFTIGVADGGGTFAGVIANALGTGNLTKAGTGTEILTGASTYSGGTTISGGTIRFSRPTALGSGTVTLNDANTGSNDTALLATDYMNSDDLPASRGSFANNIVVANQGTGTTTIGSTTFNGNEPHGYNSATYRGTLTLNRATTLSGGDTDRTTYDGVISGYVGTLTISGGARTAIGNPANSFTGNVSITGSGTTLQAGNGGFLSGFGGWQLNGGATVSNDVLTLTTDGSTHQARSAFAPTKVPTTTGYFYFVARFTYTPTSAGFPNNAADGITFVLQNSAAGTSALGGDGNGLGYNGMGGPSLAVALNIYSPNGIGTSLSTNAGTGGSTLNRAYQSVSPVVLNNSNPKNVTLTYNAADQTLYEYLTEQNTSNTKAILYTGVNLSSIFGGNTAYVGFTGADGDATATQRISNFTYETDWGTVLPSTASLFVDTNTTFQMYARAGTIDALTGSGTVQNVAVPSSVLNIGANGGGGTFSGVIRDNGGTLSLAKSGSGTEILSGANTYSGITFISGGTLQAGDGGTSGTLGTGAIVDHAALVFNRSDPLTLSVDVFVGAGGSLTSASALTLGSSGTLTVQGGGTVTMSGDFINQGTVILGASGAAGGVLNVGGNYTQSSGGTLTVQLGGTPASGNFGQLNVTGTANLAGTLTVQLNGYTPVSGDSFGILTDAAVNGDFGTKNLPPGGVWDPNAGTVTF
jgi:autotransporter-associated beta strand protein